MTPTGGPSTPAGTIPSREEVRARNRRIGLTLVLVGVAIALFSLVYVSFIYPRIHPR